MIEVVVPQDICPYDAGHCGFRCVRAVDVSLVLAHCCVQGYPWGALSASGGRGLEDSLLASQGVLRVYFQGVRVGYHETPLYPVEHPPFGFHLEDVHGRLLEMCIGCVPWGNVTLHLGGVEVLGGHTAEELIDVEGRDWVVGALGWWGHRLEGCQVPVAFVGGKGVECRGDDVLCLSVQDYVLLCAEIIR